MKGFKTNVILGKKQIVLASLVLILGAAVYLNWQFADQNGELDLTAKLEEPADPAGAILTGEEAEPAGTEPDGEKLLGDAKLVDSQAVDSRSIADETYFAMARMARTKSRDEAIQTISAILDGEQLTEEDKQAANDRAFAITDAIEEESRIENLVKAKGFEECMVYITESGASVVVKSSGLTQEQATQIKNIVVSEGRIKGENVSITELS